jgi:hypothetical protein
VVEDVIGLLMITNLLTFGSILDSRRYIDSSQFTATDHLSCSTLSGSDMVAYSLGKIAARKLLKWVYNHYYLVLVKDGVIQTENQAESLRRYRNDFLIQQAKALVVEIKESRAEKIQGENEWVSVAMVRKAMDEDLLDDDEVKALWPSKSEWNEALATGFKPRPAYSFPPPPDSCHYSMVVSSNL